MAKRAQLVTELVLAAVLLLMAAALVRTVVGMNRYTPCTMEPAEPFLPNGLPEYARVDLNRATLSELEALPSIGETLAGRLIEWREENGPFTSPEDVLSVYGIGEGTYAAIEPYITYGTE